MKMLIVAIPLLAALSAPATSADLCKVMADTAELMMQARQQGVPMQPIMDATEMTSHKRMVVEAYETPRYITKEVQLRQVQNFRDKWYMWCFKDKNQ